MSKASTRSWSLVGALALAAVVAPVGCGDAPDDDPQVTATLDAALADVGPVVEASLAAFAAQADALRVATQALVIAPQGATERAAAQTAWIDAFLAWQVAELHQLGPAGSSLAVEGGEDVRDAVYSWPTVNRCQVDQATHDEAYAASDFFDTALVPVVGLDALEVLLFAPEGLNGCLASVAMNKDGTWAALGEAEIQARRAAYADRLAERLVTQVGALRTAWDPDGDDWSGKVARAGQGGDTPFATRQDALDAILRALFYLETQTKDRKLGRPLGLVGCLDAPCPEEAEARLAAVSVEAVAANVEGFAALYAGGDGTGFDDLLVEAGHDDVATAVDAALQAVRAAASAEVPPLHEAVDDPAAEALFAAVKALTDLLKGDLTTALALRLPAESAGDAD